MEREVEFAVEDLAVPTTTLQVGEFVEARRDPDQNPDRDETYRYTVFTPGRPRLLLGHPPQDVEAKMTQIEKEFGERGFEGQIVAIHHQHEEDYDPQVRVHLMHRSQASAAKP